LKTIREGCLKQERGLELPEYDKMEIHYKNPDSEILGKDGKKF